MMGPLRVVAAVATELGDLPGIAVGVGPLRAALGASASLAGAGGCVLLGTAGAYPGGPEIGEVVVARSLGLSSGIAELGRGYAPLHPSPLSTDRSLCARIGAREVDVLTVEAITTDRELALARGAAWQVEHMEAYGVALAAASLGVPFVAVLAISNRVGPDAHVEWVAHRDAAEAAARDVVRRLIRGER